MLGNLGLAEWVIILVIVLTVMRVVTHRREPVQMTPPSPSDQAQMQRILDSLERMERRIENLETVMGQRPEGQDAETPR